MSEAGMISLGLGVLMLVCGVPPAVAPSASLRWLQRFPRDRVMAWILTALALGWSGYLLYRMDMGRFNGIKPHLLYLIPAVIVAMAYYMDELLAPRALGALFLLLPAPLLAGMRWHPSPFRYIVIVTAYGMAMDGIVLVLSPWLFRWVIEQGTIAPRAFRAVGLLASVLGMLLAVLAFTAFAAV